MPKSQMIPIASIVNSRELRPDDDLTKLSISLRSGGEGQQRPIIVDEDMNLIDGLRRVEALRLLKKTHASAVVTTTFEDTCAVLDKTRKHGYLSRPVTPLRVWEIFNATYKQQKERGARLRARPGPERAAGLEIRSRAMLGEALGFHGEGILAAATQLYKSLLTNTDPSKVEALADIRRRMEAGLLSVYSARGAISRLEKGIFLNGDIVGVADQRQALAAAVSQLNGVARGLSRIGPLGPDFTEAELQMYLKSFEDGKRHLQRFVNGLRKRANES